jgi:dnd system-associated protein 4
MSDRAATDRNRDRFYVQKDKHPVFQRLSQGDDAPFKTMKDVWVLAASMGFRAQVRQPMRGGTQHVGFWHYLSLQEDVPLLHAIAIAETGDVQVLGNRDEVIRIAEEYANGGIDLLLESERPDPDASVRALAASFIEAAPEEDLRRTGVDQLTAGAGQRSIYQLIREGESSTVEFKQTARCSAVTRAKDPAVEDAVVKTVASFLNSRGGTLLIGVSDTGKATGLDEDYKTLGKRQDRDGFSNWLTGLLEHRIGKPPLAHVEVTFDAVDGVEVARVDVAPSGDPVYVDDETLYARFNNTTRQLNVRETIDYIKRQWPELRV